MKKIIIVLIILVSISCKSQNEKVINIKLKNELDSIYLVDQNFRKALNDTSEETTIFLNQHGYTLNEFKKNTWPIISKHDSINSKRIKEIINKYGYPGKTIVGEPTNKAVWFVIQHSKKEVIEKYFPLIQKAGKNKEIPMTLVAMMQDRLLMYQGKEQIYGTQASGREITNKKTGEKEWEYFIWPIKNPEKVNELRKKNGYSTSVEKYARSMDIDYKIITIKQVNKNKVN